MWPQGESQSQKGRGPSLLKALPSKMLPAEYVAPEKTWIPLFKESSLDVRQVAHTHESTRKMWGSG